MAEFWIAGRAIPPYEVRETDRFDRGLHRVRSSTRNQAVDDRGNQRDRGRGLGRAPMRITAGTNVLVRGAALDDPAQAALAADLLRRAEIIAATLPALCEFARVLGRGYRWTASEILGFIKALLNSPGVATDRPAVEAGLAILAAGGDFADGVTAVCWPARRRDWRALRIFRNRTWNPCGIARVRCDSDQRQRHA